jgi:hypothetical protein
MGKIHKLITKFTKKTNMKKGLFTLLLSFCTFFNYAQNTNSGARSGLSAERFPVFLNCEKLESTELEHCFYYHVQNFVFHNFKVPERLQQNNFKGSIDVLFEVDATGAFKIIYANAADESLMQETKRVFDKLPKIAPSTYNGKAVYSKYTIAISIPLKSPEQSASEALARAEILPNNTKKLTELDSIIYKKFNNPEFESHLNIPFSHSYYAQFDAAMNQVGSNNHTASKPYTYTEVSKYYNLKTVNEKLKKDVSGWWARKLWNESAVEIQGEGYWFTLNPILDLQAGKATHADSYTYVNTRALNFRGGLGKQLNFTTTIFESQGRFAGYFNRYAESSLP